VPNKIAIVKVLADTHKLSNLNMPYGSADECGDGSGYCHDGARQVLRESAIASGRQSALGDDAAIPIPYRHKVIALFMANAEAEEALIFVMYVNEYGPGNTEECARQVWIKCVDSTPLYVDEEGVQRQDLLTATLLGYLEWAKLKGFREAFLKVSADAIRAVTKEVDL
jgi:hypothetical protein